MKIVEVGNITIPLDNIDYGKANDYGTFWLILKTGKKIECTREEFRYVMQQLGVS